MLIGAKADAFHRRPGWLELQKALEADRFDVLVVFATSRMKRNDYRLKQFVQEEIVERGKRAVFVMSSVDTNDPNWELNLSIRGIVDSQQAKTNTEHIRAGHTGLFLKGRVHGTITFGYRGVEVAGTKTRTGRPERKYAIDPDTSGWVERIFAWLVQDRLSMNAIVQRLNEQKAPLPPRCTSGRWTILAIRTLLRNKRYRGCWSYGEKQAVLLNRKDYVRQIRRDQPLEASVLANKGNKNRGCHVLTIAVQNRSERTWLELFVQEVKGDIVDLPEDIFALFTCCGS